MTQSETYIIDIKGHFKNVIIFSVGIIDSVYRVNLKSAIASFFFLYALSFFLLTMGFLTTIKSIFSSSKIKTQKDPDLEEIDWAFLEKEMNIIGNKNAE